MTLSLYIARKFLIAFLLVFGVFAGVLMLLDLVEELHRNSGQTISFAQAAGLAALNTPDGLYRILPLVTILAALILFLGLARTSELVVVRAAGRSALHCLLPAVLTALAIGVAGVAVMNPIVAATSDAYDQLQSHYSAHGAENVMSITREGVWLRQGNAEGQVVIRAEHASLDGTQLSNASFLSFDATGQPLMRIEAATAELGSGAWKLTDAKVWHFDSTGNPEQLATTAATMSLPSDLTRQQIRDSFGAPGEVPIWQLPGFIDQLVKAGFSAREQRVWFQMELALPLLLAAMVLIGAGFTMRHARFGQSGLLVLFALIAGFSIFFLRNFAQALGVNGQIPIMLAAWGPPVVAVFLSLGLLLHLEDG
ncbi:MAG: LPS export ABC transporter permease LptG [Rhodobacteraceae bacterium]|nr:LPS export ABC transporter permease LptG [Paracoccaceae bacterium]